MKLRSIALSIAAAAICSAAVAWFPHRIQTAAPSGLVSGSGWSGLIAQPAQQGSSGQLGFNDDAIAQWDYHTNVPYSMLTASTPICVLAYHVSGINSVTIGIDGGLFVTASQQTTLVTNGATSTYTEYCAQLDPTTLSDGEHELRAIVTPNTGYPRVLQSGQITAVTNNNPVINAGPHGLIFGKTLVADNTAAGFTACVIGSCPIYVVAGGWTGNTYALSPSTLLNVSGVANWSYAPPTLTNMAIGGGTTSPTITQAQTWNAGQAVMFRVTNIGIGEKNTIPVGMAVTTPYYVCWNSYTGGANNGTTSYNLASTAINATNGNCDVRWTAPLSGDTNPPFQAWPVVTPSATASVSFHYMNTGSFENLISNAESLYLNSNYNGTIHPYSQYVDASGSDTCSGKAGSSGSPCATVHQAIANLVAGGGTVTESAGTTNPTCAMFTRTAHGFLGGDIVDITATSLGTGFTLNPGSTSVGMAANGGGQAFYVLGPAGAATNSSTDLAANTFELSAKPGGACIPHNAGTGFTSVSVKPDASHANIYLMCDGLCSTPSQYSLGGTSESTAKNAVVGYVNILPYTGLTHNNVQLVSNPSNLGIFASKVHFGVDMASSYVTLTTNASNAAGSTGPALSFSDTSALASGNWFINDGAGCASDGAYVSGQYTGGNAVTITTGGVNLTATNFATCPSGTNIQFVNSWVPGKGYMAWLDGINFAGGGGFLGDNSSLGSGTNYITGAVYATNVIESGHAEAFPNFNYVWNTKTSHTGNVAYNGVMELVASSSYTNGLDWKQIPMTISSTSIGSAVLSVPAGLPANTRTGLNIYNVTGTCIPTGAYVKGYDKTAKTITMSAVASVNCGSTAVTLDIGWHGDWAFDNGQMNNKIVANSFGTENSQEIFFQQIGPFFDIAYVGSNAHVYPVGGQPDILLETIITNGYFAENQLSIFPVQFRSDLSFIGTDIYFVNNTCATPGSVTSAASAVSGVTVIPGTGGC